MSTYGCGSHTCLDCYPYQYACDWCGERFEEKIANGEDYVCDNCDFDSRLLDVENAFI